MRFPLGNDRKDRNDGNEGKDNTDGHDGEKRQSRRTRRRHAAANVLEVITDPGDGISDDDFVDAEKSDSEEAPATPAPSGEKGASESLPENSPEPASPVPDLSEPTLPHPATDVLLDRFASVDARLNTMNTVLRQQAETISDLNERRLYSRLTGPAEKLAEIHDDLVADLADLADTDDAFHAGDLAYLLDGIADVLESMGVDIVEVRSGDAYDANVHRRTRFEEVGDPELHRTVGTLPRAVHYYRFSRAEPPIVVTPAKVPIRRLSDGADRTASAAEGAHDG